MRVGGTSAGADGPDCVAALITTIRNARDTSTLAQVSVCGRRPTKISQPPTRLNRMGIFRPVELRQSLGTLFAVGALCWPVGYWVIGGSTGRLVAGLGSFMVLAAIVAELVLRHHERS